MVRLNLTLAAIGLFAFAATTCADSSPTPVDLDDELGSVSAAMHDSARVLPANRTTQWPADSMAYDGTLSGSAQVHIYSDTDGWISLHDPVDVSFEIFCLEDAIITADAQVPVGTYSQVRLTLRGFTANVEAGAIVAGSLLPDARVITLGGAGAEVVIEKSVTPFQVTETTPTSVIFDLNTDTWINTTVAGAGTIGAAEIQAGTVVYVR
ncbi:MAG: hypothetical protein AB7T31_05080 [Gemmatimonadales bacterium]